MSSEKERRILIVDDTRENIDVLGEILSGYKKSVALDGERAIKLAHEVKPDLILLDIMMPGMDGFEVCSRLKGDPVTKDIPIIFITAKNQIEDEVKGLGLGAIDFIAKPISPPVVLARVKNHLELREAQEVVISQNIQLTNTLNELKNTQEKLILSEKMASLGALVSNIAHEINSPFSAIKSSNEMILSKLNKYVVNAPNFFRSIPADLFPVVIKLLFKSLDNKNSLMSADERKLRKELSTELAKEGVEDAMDIASQLVDLGVTENVSEYLPIIHSGYAKNILDNCMLLSDFLSNSKIINLAVEKVSKIVFALKAYSRSDVAGEKSMYKISTGIDIALALYYNQMKHKVELIKKYNYDEPVLCYADELNQVWMNIVQNSLQAMNYSGRLAVDMSKKDKYIVVSISDNGNGIPDNIKGRIFEPFFTSKPLGEGSGIGLHIVKKIIDKHNGKIEFESQVGFGTTFRIYIPDNK